MGDRANIAVEYSSGLRVYLYTHWAGSDTPHTVKEALAKRWRWDDESYLARIIFDTMTRGDHGGETGYGIDVLPAWDAEHPLLVVNPSKQVVTMHAGRKPGPALKTWTFREFLETGHTAFED